MQWDRWLFLEWITKFSHIKCFNFQFKSILIWDKFSMKQMSFWPDYSRVGVTQSVLHSSPVDGSGCWGDRPASYRQRTRRHSQPRSPRGNNTQITCILASVWSRYITWPEPCPLIWSSHMGEDKVFEFTVPCSKTGRPKIDLWLAITIHGIVHAPQIRGTPNFREGYP